MRKHTASNPKHRSRLAAVLYARGLTFYDLAGATDYAVETLHNLASASWKSPTARAKVEAVLGQTIWETENDGTDSTP